MRGNVPAIDPVKHRRVKDLSQFVQGVIHYVIPVLVGVNKCSFLLAVEEKDVLHIYRLNVIAHLYHETQLIRFADHLPDVLKQIAPYRRKGRFVLVLTFVFFQCGLQLNLCYRF